MDDRHPDERDLLFQLGLRTHRNDGLERGSVDQAVTISGVGSGDVFGRRELLQHVGPRAARLYRDEQLVGRQPSKHTPEFERGLYAGVVGYGRIIFLSMRESQFVEARGAVHVLKPRWDVLI
jgi:hypothetical protein